MSQNDPDYTLELKILLAEWAVYTGLNRYNSEMSWNGEIPKNLSDAEMFESCPLYHVASRIYNDISWFLGRVNIVNSGPIEDRAICKYVEIPDQIKNNITRLDHIPFIPIAEYVGYFGKSERDAFFTEEACKPILNRLVNEGYCEQNGQEYNWTNKMRPYLEACNVWKSPEDQLEYEKSQDSFESDLIARINNFVRGNAIAKAEADKVFGSHGIEFRLENYMTHESVEEPEPEPPIVFKWFGPV